MSINLIFLVGTFIFASASVYFWVIGGGKEFNSPLLVAAVTTLSYLIMWEGSLLTQLTDGAVVHWTRWVGYAISCPLLFYVVASGIDSAKQRFTLTGITSAVMLTGAFAAVWTGWFFWAGFVFSTFLFAVAIHSLYRESDEDHLQPMHKYIWFGWVIFPVVFLLGPAGLYIGSAGVVAFLYLLLDVYTKIIFYLELAYRQQHSEQGYLAAISGLFR